MMDGGQGWWGDRRGLQVFKFQIVTLPETNMAPENGPSQKETSIPTIFSGAMLVRECKAAIFPQQP